jgi:hypothetical protein
VADAAESRDVSFERLSSRELHDLAVRHARHHMDVRFFWRLMELLPAAQAAAGELQEAEADVAQARAHIGDGAAAGRGEVAEQLRPFFLEYVTRHVSR